MFARATVIPAFKQVIVSYLKKVREAEINDRTNPFDFEGSDVFFFKVFTKLDPLRFTFASVKPIEEDSELALVLSLNRAPKTNSRNSKGPGIGRTKGKSKNQKPKGGNQLRGRARRVKA